MATKKATEDAASATESGGGASEKATDGPSSVEAPLAAVLHANADPEEDLPVEVAYEVIQLLSAQLYSSPLKAIEELVVNSWDADANECRIYVPDAAQLETPADETALAVLDNGHGMTVADLRDLWHVGSSNKREDAWKTRAKRAQIGKFGIGKLASYAIARRVTYLTKTGGEPLRGVSIDFEDFNTVAAQPGTTEPIELTMLKLNDASNLLADPAFKRVLEGLGTEGSTLDEGGWSSWTLVVLEQLKHRARDIRLGRLKWVLSTAMPAAADFTLYLNDSEVESSKLEQKFPVDFGVHEVDDARLGALKEDAGEEWTKDGERLVAPSFPSGVSGRVRVADRSLYAASGKSEDLGRSHGFFVRVRGRLVNETDPLFGAKPLSFTTFYNLLAEVEADDLDSFITAPRDDLEQVEEKKQFRALLLELFRDARTRYEAVEAEREKQNKEKREEQKTYVSPRLVERPVADALVHESRAEDGPGWVLLKTGEDPEALEKLVESLYSDEEDRRKYAYKYSAAGRQEPLASFDPDDGVFWVNEDHDLVVANYDDPEARRLLEVVVTAEAMLEVYLREIGLEDRVVQHLLGQRDQLLRSLARDELYSLKAIAASVREAVESAKELEIAAVGALRALGFTARHISGSGTPDGEARYRVYGPEPQSFTIETKSSKDVPDLGTLDFAGLRQHYEDEEEAAGCLLVSPDYPGRTEGNESQVAKRASTQGVSCWTVELLARVVEAAEVRHLTADAIQRIVLSTFTPDDAEAAVEKLLTEPGWTQRELYQAILTNLEQLEQVLEKSPRDVSMLAGRIATTAGFEGIQTADIMDAAEHMAKASKGMLHVTQSDGVIHVPGSLDELRRRLRDLTGNETQPRRRGTFRNRTG